MPRVLVVEDDPACRSLIAHALDGRVASVVAPSSLAEVAECIETLRLDVILLDIKLQCTDGRELLDAIRRSRLARTSVVLAVTGLAEPSDRDDLLAAGFDGYLAKPFGVNELRDFVRAHIGASRVREAGAREQTG